MAPGSPNLLIRFDSEVDNFLRDLEAAVGGTEQLRAGLAGIAVAAGAVSATTIALGSTAIATGSRFEQLSARLTTTLGSKGAAEAALKRIQAFASSTPFGVDEITESFISLNNRGIDPTTELLRKLGDIAGAQAKPLQQITESILDATSGGGFERLNEFGIKASKAGNSVTISFKGVNKTVADTPEAITGAIAAGSPVLVVISFTYLQKQRVAVSESSQSW